MVKVPGLLKSLANESIIWVQGDGNYAWVHTINNRPCLVCQTLKWFEGHFVHFVRVHKSALINPTHVTRFNPTTPRDAQILLSNGIKLVVSRRRVSGVADQLRLVV